MTANISNLKTEVELWNVLYFAKNNVTHCWQDSTTVCNSFTVSFSAHQRCLEQPGAPNSFLSSVTWQYVSVMDGASQTGEHSSHRTYPAPEVDAILGGQTPHSHLLKPVKKNVCTVSLCHNKQNVSLSLSLSNLICRVKSNPVQSDSQRRGSDSVAYLQWPLWPCVHTSRVESSPTSLAESRVLMLLFRQSDSSDRAGRKKWM